MYQPGGDMPQFRAVPAASPPLRMMGPPLIPPPSSTPPSGRPPIHGPMPGRPPLMQQYLYPPPASQHPPPSAPQHPPPLLVPPPVSLRGPPPSMHPSMQPSLPSMQRSLPTMHPNMPPSLLPVHPSRPLLQPPPPPLQAGFSSMQPSLPAVRPVPTPFQPPLMQVPPPLSFVPGPLSLIQPPPFLPPLPASPPSENPPPPPPPSPPPQPPPLPLVEESSLSLVGALLPPEPPKPSDPEMLKNIDVLAAFVAKNGPRFESMARARQAGDPKFAFLFESDASPEAAIGHEFYKWKKQTYAVEFGLENENKKNNQADLGAASGRDLHAKATPGQPLLRDVFPASPTMSDMDMEDDFIPSPTRQPLGHPDSVNLDLKERDSVKVLTMGSEMVQKNARASAFESTNNMRTMYELDGSLKGVFLEGTSQKRSFPNDAGEALFAHSDGKNLETAESSSKNHFSNLLNTDENKQIDSHRASIKNGADRGLEQSMGLPSFSDLSSGNRGLEAERKLDVTDMSLDVIPNRSERRMGRLSRWESLPITQSNAALEVSRHDTLPHNKDGGVRKVEETLSPRYDGASKNFVDGVTDIDKESKEIHGIGRPPDTGSLQPKEEALSVDEFGRLVRKEAIESESEDDMRPRKRRRSYSRSRSQSRSRGRGKSRSRSRSGSRGGSRSRSRSPSFSSGESRWRRLSFSRSPRRGRRSRSRSHSPGRWPRNESRSPSREMRWGGMGRGDRDWRGEREPYGRGRRAGRGSGPSVCFHFARGRCFRGTACRFLHPEKEIGQDRGMLSTDVQAPVLKDAELGQGAFAAHKSLTGADSYMDQLDGGKEDWEAGRTESDRETDTLSILVDSTKANSVIRSPGSNREVFAVSDNSAQAANGASTGSTSQTGRYGARFSVGNMESVESLASVGEDAEKTVGDASKKAALDEVVAKSDNREIGVTAKNSEVHERLEALESTRKDADEKLDTNGSKKLVDRISQTNQGSEFEVGDMNIKVQHKDPMDGATSPHEPSEMVLDKRSPIYDTGKPQRPLEGKVPKKSVPDFVLESEMLESKDISRKGSAELASAKSDVGLEVPGGPEKSKTPLSASLSPIPFSQGNLKGKSMHITGASDNLSEQRHGAVFGHQPLESGQYPSPAAKRLSPQLQPLPSPPLNIFSNTSSGYSIGNFTPSHLLSPSLGSGNAGGHNTFSINNNQHTPIHHEPMHGALRSQPSHSASFPPHLGFSQNTSQESLVPPQDRLPNFTTHQPGQFALNSSILHGHGIRPLPVKEPQEWSGNFSSAKEDSAYARLFGDGEKQYIHTNPPNDVLQHAYPRQGIIASATSISTPMAWKDDSLVASRSILVSSAEKPHYSYTLTTIPPLPNIIKRPGSSSLPGAGEQYDPLSDVLDVGSSGALKSLSSKPPSDRRPVGVGFLENLSPGLEPEKVNMSAPKLEVDNVNTNEAAADVGVVENVSPPGDWSPVQPGDAAIVGHDQLHSKSKKSNRGLKLLRTAVADRVKALLKQPWKEGRLSKDAFKTIAKKAVEKVTGNLPSHHIPKSQEKVDQFMSVSSSKIAKLVQGYVDKYSKVQS